MELLEGCVRAVLLPGGTRQGRVRAGELKEGSDCRDCRGTQADEEQEGAEGRE